MAFLNFYITCPDENTAREISRKLVAQRLAACANFFPISSVYWWENAIQQEGEWVLILKTRPELEDTLEAALQKLHPYEVPCIMRYEVRANASYEAWIRESTQAP